MPGILMSLESTDTTVERYIAHEVIRNLIKRTGFPEIDDIIDIEKSGATRKKSDKDETKLHTKHTDAVLLETNSRHSEDLLLNSMSRVHKNDRPLIVDNDLGILVQPVYTQLELTLNARFRTRSRAAMKRWARDMAARSKLSPLSFPMELSYNYALPVALSMLLENIYGLTTDTPNDFEGFINDRLTNEHVRRSRMDGEKSQIAINEVMQHVNCTFSDQAFFNSVEYTVEGNEAAVEMKVSFEAPIFLKVNFPHIVHNKSIDAKFIEAWLIPQIAKQDANIYENSSPTSPGVLVPYRDGGERTVPFDDWFPRDPFRLTKTVLISPLIVSENSPRDILDLNNVADLIPEPVLRFIKKYHAHCHTYMAAPYLVEVFEVGAGENHIPIRVDGNGVVTSMVDVDVTKRYYVRVSYVLDPALLNTHSLIKSMLSELQDTKDGLYMVAGGLIQHSEKPESGKLHLSAGGGVTIKSYSEILKQLPKVNKNFKEAGSRSMKTVMNSSIIAKRT